MKQSVFKILVATHKPSKMYQDDIYIPMQVGKKISSYDLHILADDTGDNISEKNSTYCELTALYWAWKNMKNVDFIGLCHYRRYFDFHKQVPQYLPNTFVPLTIFNSFDFTIPESIKKILLKGYIIKPKKLIDRHKLFIQYCLRHISDDIRILTKIINTGDKKYAEAYKNVMLGNKYSPYNMFIMPWNEFDNYCKWLFYVLGETEKLIDVSHYNPVQKRIYGYMSERLLDVYVYANQVPCKEYPVITITDDSKLRNMSMMEYYMKALIKNISSSISLPPEV